MNSGPSYSVASARILRLSIEDAEDVGRLQREAFAGSQNAALGSWYATTFVRWFAHHGIGFVATVNGRAVGYVLGAEEGYERALRWAVVVPGLWGLLRNPGLLLRSTVRRGVLARLTPPRPSTDRDVRLVAIGTHPDQRGKGIGAELLVAFEREVARRGFGRMHLSVESGNAPARSLYETAGWIKAGATQYSKAVSIEPSDVLEPE